MAIHTSWHTACLLETMANIETRSVIRFWCVKGTASLKINRQLLKIYTSCVMVRKQTWKWYSVLRIRQGRCWRKAATRAPEYVHSGWQCDWYRLGAGYSAGECVQHWRRQTAELQRRRSKQRAKELHIRSHNSSYGTHARDMLRPKSTAVLAVPCYRGGNVNHATP